MPRELAFRYRRVSFNAFVGQPFSKQLYMSLAVNLIGQRSRDVIGCLSVSRDVIGCEDCKKVAQVVETSVKVTPNSPSQDYSHPDDHNLRTYDSTPGFKPFTVLL